MKGSTIFAIIILVIAALAYFFIPRSDVRDTISVPKNFAVTHPSESVPVYPNNSGKD